MVIWKQHLKVYLLALLRTSSLIIAEKTPFFKYLGKVFEPLHLLRIPNVQEIAPSFPVGIAEMLLPVLLINVDLIHPGARYIVVAVIHCDYILGNHRCNDGHQTTFEIMGTGSGFL